MRVKIEAMVEEVLEAADVFETELGCLQTAGCEVDEPLSAISDSFFELREALVDTENRDIAKAKSALSEIQESLDELLRAASMLHSEAQCAVDEVNGLVEAMEELETRAKK
jgi:chromosome segregation ATPase